MSEYTLNSTSDEYGERGHCWIEKDGQSIDIEYVITDIEELQEKLKEAFRLLDVAREACVAGYHIKTDEGIYLADIKGAALTRSWMKSVENLLDEGKHK